MKLFVILISFVYGTAICCYALGILPKPAIDSGANDRRKAPVVTTTEYELVTVHPPPLREKKSFKKIATHKHNHQGNVPRGVESSCL